MPVKGRIRVLLTVENILRRTTDYDIYRYYLKRDFAARQPLFSPFRTEENPSFTITVGKNNKLYHLDYGDSRFSGDVFNFVCQLFNITPAQALMKIDHDLNLGIITHSPEAKLDEMTRITPTVSLEPKKPSIIQVVSRKFNREELEYWRSYHLSEEILRKNEVYPVKTLYLERKKYPLRGDLCFAYLFVTKKGETKWKIYWPERKKGEKWLSNVPNTQMSGMDKIKKGDEYVIITKAKKDEMVLSLFLPRVVSAQNESIYSINEENLSVLKECPNSFVNFDNDETGILACKYYNQFGLKWINCPSSYKDPKNKQVKDFADLARYYGIETVMAYFRKKHIPIITT